MASNLAFLAAMMPEDLQSYTKLASVLKNLPKTSFWTAYDAELDRLYVNFYSPLIETGDSELLQEDLLIRYRDNTIVGLTILNASQH